MELDIEVSVPARAGYVLPVPVTSVDQLLITGDAILRGWSLREASGDLAVIVEGSVTSPAANATIVTTAPLSAGTYDVSWEVELSGTLAVGDANNFQLMNGAAVVVNSVNGFVAGTYPQNPTRVTVVAGGTISVRANAIGTVGAVYSAQPSVTPDPLLGAAVELQDSNGAIGEIGIDFQESQTVWFSGDGIPVRGQILLHMLSGIVTGVVYATYNR